MTAAKRKADDVAQDLMRRIVSGTLSVGAILPRESDLAESYGVGRSVVREANKLLEVHRLVQPTRRKGTVVLDPLRSVTPAVLRAMLLDERGQIDRDMLGEFLEIRALLDAEMTRLAAERRTQQDLVELERAAKLIDDAEPGTPASFDAVNAFGSAVASATKNRIFVMLAHWHAEIASDLEPLLARVRAPVARQQGHRLLVEAIRKKDSALAASLVVEFHRWANKEILDAARAARRTKKTERGPN